MEKKFEHPGGRTLILSNQEVTLTEKIAHEQEEVFWNLLMDAQSQFTKSSSFSVSSNSGGESFGHSSVLNFIDYLTKEKKSIDYRIKQ